MSNTMDKRKLQAMANELAKDVKTPEDHSTLSASLTKLTVEATLKAEMDYHLGYEKNDPSGHYSGKRSFHQVVDRFINH
jgi:putative transposase